MGYSGSSVSEAVVRQAIPCFEWSVLDGISGYVSVQGTWAVNAEANCALGKHLDNTATHALNDEIRLGYPFYVPTAGTYKVSVICVTNNARGIAHIKVDGSDVGNIDMYSAATVFDAQLDSTTSSISAGVHTWSISMDSKNASSSDYYCAIQAIAITKA